MKEDVKELVESAEEDLGAARIALVNGLYNTAAFHSHQCVEKLLKAYLLERKGSYPFIHSISRLLHEIIDIDEDFKRLYEIGVYKLDRFYTGTRYPPLLRVSREEAREALEIAEKARDFVLKRLKVEGE